MLNRIKKSFKSLSVLAAVLFVFSAPVQAGTLPASLQTALTQIYNADFTRAAASIQAHIQSNPADATGYLLRGFLGEWDQVVNNKKNGNNPQIMADYKKARELASAAHDKDENNIDNMVLLGNAHMYVAKKMIDTGSKMGGGFELKKGKELMLKAIEKNPNLEDAYMALGIFNYFSESVPSGFKWLTVLMGFNGNKVDGLRYLQRAASAPNLTQGDAGFLLTYIYNEREKNYALATQFNNVLKQKYPGNPAFQYKAGEILFNAKKYDEAQTQFNNFFAFCSTKPKGVCNNKYLFLANYYSAKRFAIEQKVVEGKKFITAALATGETQYTGANQDLELWQGLIAMAENNTTKASEHFNKVVANKKANPSAASIAQGVLAKMQK